ncbi:hypothetical protein E4U17_001357 [Claviceps sp. LM77 group G4]|nr:hypothetical protein E4U17_001357 [Claviceps sp. LM77 group G4]KAG6066669.1 hypothetical protein E4U33_005523 [Claviceps sp. LM78 group G4]
MSPSDNSSSSATRDSPTHSKTQDDGARSVPLSAEGGVYSRDGQNEPKGGTAGEKGVSIGGEEKNASARSKV